MIKVVLSFCFYIAKVDDKMDTYLGTLGVDMDGRFGSVRTMETNLGKGEKPGLYILPLHMLVSVCCILQCLLHF